MIHTAFARLSGESRTMVKFVVKVTTDPTRRFVLFWNAVGWGLCTLLMVLGAGYAVGGNQATNSASLRLLVNLEGNSVHIHGYVLMGLALALSHGLGEHYSRTMHWTLRVATFYCVVTALLIFGGWVVYDVDFAAPWWYLFAAFISTILQAFAPVRPYLDLDHVDLRDLQGSGRA